MGLLKFTSTYVPKDTLLFKVTLKIHELVSQSLLKHQWFKL